MGPYQSIKSSNTLQISQNQDVGARECHIFIYIYIYNYIYIYIYRERLTTPAAIHRRPLLLLALNKRQELSGTFLAVRGRTEKPDKQEHRMEVFITLLPLAGCTLVAVDALMHVLGGCILYEFFMLQARFLTLLASFCRSGSARDAGGWQEARPVRISIWEYFWGQPA